MRYQVTGLADDGKAVQVELGYDEDTKFWFGVDRGDVELASEVEIQTLPELMNLTRGWLTWSRRLYQTMLNAPLASYVTTHPNDPVTKMLVSFDDRLKSV